MTDQEPADQGPAHRHRPRARIVVGVDGSEAARHALRWAAHLTGPLNATLEAVIVWHRQGPHRPDPHGYVRTPNFWNPGDDATRILNGTLDDVFTSGRPAGLRTTVIEGQAANALIDIGRDALILVVGSRGHGWATLLGSVSAACAGRSLCPVLVVHETDVLPAADLPTAGR
jgi:nucleotide-binding universal stress UspA family protein